MKNKNDWQKILAAGGEISLSVQAADGALIAQHFLRHYRGQSTYLIEDRGLPENIIENIRSSLREGQLTRALKDISDLTDEKLTHEGKLELLIEKIRHSLFTGDLYEALDYSALFFSLSPVCEVSKMTVLQLRSDIYLRLDEIDLAFENAQAAYHWAKLYPLASSATSACMFLAILYSKKNNNSEAFHLIQQHESVINSSESVELWLDRQLIICRGKFRIYIEMADYENAFVYLKISETISEFNQQKIIHAQCQSDLLKWADDFKPHIEKHKAYSRNQMIYIARLGVLIDLDSRQIYRMNKNSTQEKIILALLRGITDKSQLFETVWGLKYNKDLHGGLIRTHFYQLKKVILHFARIQI